MPACPQCDKDNPDGFTFCGFCGAALAGDASDAGEERKTVTVLFADLVGFTASAERLDPEDVRRLLSPYYARVRAQLERHGGTVEKFIGDAVMAVFGAPVAHEDDPERAVRAAIAIRDELGAEEQQLSVRIAVNTGEALVTLGARPSEGEGMVAGDVVNTAARMQSAAPVNGILAGETTYRATNDVIEYRRAEPISAKGKAEPVPVWEAVAARSRFGLDVEQRTRTALVGRERELGFLVDALDRARSERSPQLVTLVGVPGIGKSRLVGELFQVIERETDITLWRQGRSLPYGETLSFWALAEIVKAQAGIAENDDQDAAAEKLRQAVDLAMQGSDEAAWVLAHLRPLVGLSGADEGQTQDKNEAFSAWRRFLEGIAEQRPLVLVFEDIHWADDGLLDFVDHLADWASAVPLLIVCMARPELLDRRPGWGGGKRNAATQSIGALTKEDTSRLLADLLDQALLPAEIHAVVLERAEGNPLYAEEYVRMLRDRGLLRREDDGVWRLESTEELPLPEGVQGMIAARLDALSPQEKELAQNAAVVGKVFWPGALAAMGGTDTQLVERGLHGLERKEFVRREARSAVSGERQYAFLHILVRDVAYSQIPRRQRADKHRRIADWISSLSDERSEDRAEMLAYHYVEALELARAAGVDTAELVAPARAALVDASERAIALNSAGPALRFAVQALELTPPEDPLTATLLVRCLRARWLLGQFDESSGELGPRAVDAALTVGDPELAAEALSMLAQFHWVEGGTAEADRLSMRATELVRDLPASAVRARVYTQHGRRRLLRGEVEDGEAFARAALADAQALGLDDVASHAHDTIGLALFNSGNHEAGISELRQSIDIALRINAPLMISVGYVNLSNLLMSIGRLGESWETLRRARVTNERFGSTSGIQWCDAETAYHLWVRGEWDETLRVADAFLAAGDEARYQRGGVLSIRADIRAARGDAAGALEDSAAALELAREIGDTQGLVPSLLWRARVLFAVGRRDEGNDTLDELLGHGGDIHFVLGADGAPLVFREAGREEDLAPHLGGSRAFAAWAEPGLAVLEGRLREAAEIYERLGAMPEAARAWLAEGELAARESRSDADAALRRAAEQSRRLGATVYAERAESLLTRSA